MSGRLCQLDALPWCTIKSGVHSNNNNKHGPNFTIETKVPVTGVFDRFKRYLLSVQYDRSVYYTPHTILLYMLTLESVITTLINYHALLMYITPVFFQEPLDEWSPIYGYYVYYQTHRSKDLDRKKAVMESQVRAIRDLGPHKQYNV